MNGSPVASLLAQANECIQVNNLGMARELCELAIRASPQNPNAFLLAGRVAVLGGQWNEAVKFFEQSISLAPQAAGPRFWLGNSYRALGNHAAAIIAFGDALRLSPGDSAAAFNLGQSQLSLGDTASAGQSFVIAARSCGAEFDAAAHQRVIECALGLSSAAPSLGLELTFDGSKRSLMISIVCCSITPSKAEGLRVNLSRLLVGRPWEFLLIEDAQSLCEGYQRGVAKSKGDVIVFCHDDIEIIVDDFYNRLLDALEDSDVVGVAGTTIVNGPAVFWARHPYCHGWVTQQNSDGGFLPTPMSMSKPRVDNAQALDGLFIAAHRAVFATVQFDPITFDGFHFYDLDFTYRAHLAGLRVRIQCDILIVHASSGNFDEQYLRYAERFAKKFPGACCAPPSPPVHFKSVTHSKQALRDMYRWICYWIDQGSESATQQ
jgi:tetratricopeptide (TPR) repeat protein